MEPVTITITMDAAGNVGMKASTPHQLIILGLLAKIQAAVAGQQQQSATPPIMLAQAVPHGPLRNGGR